MDFDVDTQKTLMFLIMRSQKPLAVSSLQHFILTYILLLRIIHIPQILVGGTYPMNLKMLQSLLNVIYSFFTLLRRVYG